MEKLDDIRADLVGALTTLRADCLTDKQKIDELDEILISCHKKVVNEIDKIKEERYYNLYKIWF